MSTTWILVSNASSGKIFRNTGPNKGLVPVVQVDDRIIGDGRPGPRTVVLMRALEQRTMQFATQIAES